MKCDYCIKIEQEDFGTLIICALRYCKNRKSYMPALVLEIAKSYLTKLSDKDLGVINKDLEDFDYKDYYVDWLSFKKDLLIELDKRNHKN